MNDKIYKTSIGIWVVYRSNHPDSTVHGANMGPIWGRLDPGGPHVDPMNFVIWAEIWSL